MHKISERQMISIWENGAGQHSIDRALTILMTANPTEARSTYAKWSIGQRNLELLKLREEMFGPDLPSSMRCSECTEQLEFTANVKKFYQKGDERDFESAESKVYRVMIDGFDLHYRFINSFDLAAIAEIKDLRMARKLLIQRCLLEVKNKEKTVEVKDLSESTLALFSEHLQSVDPLAVIFLEAVCPACSAPLEVAFDIVTYLWDEIVISAKRWLDEVHCLAFAYGWSEAEILSLSRPRRQFYLERISP